MPGEGGGTRTRRSAEFAPQLRWPLGRALVLARGIERGLREQAGLSNVQIGGSVRRRKESIGDLNFLVAARRPTDAFAAFAALPEVAQLHRRGHDRARFRLHGGIDAEVRVVPEHVYGAALIFCTGSEAHHRALCEIARRRRLDLNERGLFRGERMVAGRSEAEVYRALGLSFVPPELREAAGEVQAAQSCALPPLIEHGDLRGDLRVYCDAARPAAVEAIARAAAKLGLEYLTLTLRLDHRRGRTANAARIGAHANAIRAMRGRCAGVWLLAGAEVAIRRDGSLSIDDAVLAQLDVVTAVLRDPFDQRYDGSARILRAIENPHVDLLVHPALYTGADREKSPVDIDAVIAGAKRTGTALEIEASPDQFDLRGEDVRRALDAGVRVAIDSGARDPEQLAQGVELAVAVARRGWARRSDLLNAFPLAQCLAQLKGGGRRPSA